MRTHVRQIVLCVVVLLAALAGPAGADQLDRRQLRDLITQLGYEVKDLDTTPGKEKYSFTVQRGGLNIPVAAEISVNGRFVWLTVFCKNGAPAGEKAVGLLRKNADIQPAQFYVTASNKLMLGVAIENQGLTGALLRDRAEKIVNDVVNTRDDWQ